MQFLDGDCELAPGWLECAAGFLSQHEDVAAVGGRLREKHPERTVYNLLCDIEWDAPRGAARTCGGNAMMRVDALVAARGFRADLVAGEEPELCARLRAAGWRIWRLDADMAAHDAAISRFGQWWRRTLRAGYAFAQNAALHGAPPERLGVRESRSAWFWGFALPLLTVTTLPWLGRGRCSFLPRIRCKWCDLGCAARTGGVRCFSCSASFPSSPGRSSSGWSGTRT